MGRDMDDVSRPDPTARRRATWRQNARSEVTDYRDAWPHTRRPLPWLMAIFLAVVFLVPIEAIHLKVSLPFSSDLDRFFVALIFGTWGVDRRSARERESCGCARAAGQLE